MNKVFKGDCLKKLELLTNNSVDLIYLDPPFFTQQVHKSNTRDGLNSFEFSDQWKNLEHYLQELEIRIRIAHRKLKKTGSLFLHCDSTASHYLKVRLDGVFGRDQFRSEIIWSFKRWSNSKKGLQNNHQNILFYSKSNEFKFNSLFDEYSVTTNLDQIIQQRTRDSRNKSIYLKNSNGESVLATSKKGVPLGDVWYIPFLNPKANERVGYPTQKPLLLLEKIIQLVTDEGDLVVDPYCGSGSTLVAAKLLKRNYFGCDISPQAVSLAEKRLANPIKTNSKFLTLGAKAYETHSDESKKILKKFSAKPVQRNKAIDGLISGEKGLTPIKICKANEAKASAENLNKVIQKKGFTSGILFIKEKINNSEKLQLKKEFKKISFKTA